MSEPIVVIGAGLAGTLLAILLAARGHEVDVYEAHEPSGLRPHGRSINLTLCDRGFAALAAAGVDERVRACAVPAYGRMLHRLDHSRVFLPYGTRREALFAISRDDLIDILLEHAAATPGVRLHFGQRCIDLDLDGGRVEFEGRDGRRSSAVAPVIIGADGAFSRVRLQLQQQYDFDYAQHYSSYAYIELPIVPAAAGDWPDEHEALHLWARGESMLLAIPNRGGSFTGTLLLPSRGEGSRACITDAAALLALFEANFADALPHLPDLAATFFAARPIPMVTIRCRPWSHDGRILLIGDAAHAVFPSKGQGANAALEDCLVLTRCLDVCAGHWPDAIARFEAERRPHTDVIAELSRQHLTDLRKTMGTEDFELRARLEHRLSELFPGRYRSLYAMIAFSDLPYADALAIEHGRRGLVDELLEHDAIRADPCSADARAAIERAGARHGLVRGLVQGLVRETS